MASDKGRRENQHYVPKLLLRNFVSNPGAKRGSERVWCFNKATGNAFNPNIRNIAAQFGFYDLAEKQNGGLVSFETHLSALEDRVGPAIAHVLSERSLAGLTPEQRAWLLVFCAIQLTRVEQTREAMRQMNDALGNLLRRQGADPNQVQGFKILTEDDVKEFAVRFMFDSAHEFSRLLGAKCAFLMEAPQNHSFYIGDNPLAMHNRRRFGPYGNIGLALPGIELYLPLSPRLTLALWDPDNLDEIERQVEQADRIRREALLARAMGSPLGREADELLARGARGIKGLRRLMDAAKTGGAVLSDPEEVTRLNSLQVRWAARFIMSAVKDFALVEKMISDNPSFRGAPKISVG